MTMLWVSPAESSGPMPNQGAWCDCAYIRCTTLDAESRLVTDLDGPAKVAAYDQVGGVSAPVTTQD